MRLEWVHPINRLGFHYANVVIEGKPYTYTISRALRDGLKDKRGHYDYLVRRNGKPFTALLHTGLQAAKRACEKDADNPQTLDLLLPRRFYEPRTYKRVKGKVEKILKKV